MLIIRIICAVITVFGGIIGVVLLIPYLIDRHDAIAGKPTIKFTNFRKWYCIKPDAWALYTWFVLKKDLATQNWDPLGYSLYGAEEAVFCFSLVDSIKYKLWLRERKKLATMKAESAVIRKLLESVQKDIEEYLEK